MNRAVILEEWEQVSKEYCEWELTEEEKRQFEQAQFAAEQTKKTTVPKAGGFFIYKVMFLKNIPIKEISLSEQQPFINFVDKIFAITKDADYPNNFTKQAKVHEYESQIDQMVYELYRLTEEEIKIVENFNK